MSSECAILVLVWRGCAELKDASCAAISFVSDEVRFYLLLRKERHLPADLTDNCMFMFSKLSRCM